MCVIKVWCLPHDLPQERYRELHRAVVGAVVSVKELGLKDESDMVTLFPADLMIYGLGTEIVIEVTELWEKPERTEEVRKRLTEGLVLAVKALFPDAAVMSYVSSFDLRQGFCLTDEGLDHITISSPIGVEDIIDLRHRVLRTGLPIETAHFDGDNNSMTWHFAAFLSDHEGEPLGSPICCASFTPEALDDKLAWRLRGMATEPVYQGFGVGGRVLEAADKIFISRGPSLLWCNARESAVKFYERNGWTRISDVFDIATAGPHIKMMKQL